MVKGAGGYRFRGTNPYFSQLEHRGEQELWQDLVEECVQQTGQDMIYLPRQIRNFDQITGSDALSSYNLAIPLEFYVTSGDGFGGNAPYFQKFGLTIPDTATFTVVRRRFEEEVGPQTGQTRPNEGDLVYFPLNNKCFVIRSVNYKPYFYQHGALPTYDLEIGLFQYSGEQFSTGIPEIDRLQVTNSTNIFDWAILMENGDMIATENGDVIVSENYKIDTIDPGAADNQAFQTEANNYLSWDVRDPFTKDSGTY